MHLYSVKPLCLASNDTNSKNGFCFMQKVVDPNFYNKKKSALSSSLRHLLFFFHKKSCFFAKTFLLFFVWILKVPFDFAWRGNRIEDKNKYLVKDYLLSTFFCAELKRQNGLFAEINNFFDFSSLSKKNSGPQNL